MSITLKNSIKLTLRKTAIIYDLYRGRQQQLLAVPENGLKNLSEISH